MAVTTDLYRRVRRAWLRRTDFAGAPVFVDAARVAEYRNAAGEPDFIPHLAPWLDRPDADIDAYVRSVKDVPRTFDLGEKLHAWRRDGFVIFEQAVSHELIDAYIEDLHELFRHHTEHDEVLVDHKLYNGPGGNVSIARVAAEDLSYQDMRVISFHHRSVAGKKLSLNAPTVEFLRHVFRDDVVAMQTLTFPRGSQQGLHQDFPYVVPGNPSHLAASWIALEDIHADAGPLGYVPGSHRVRKYDWGPGNGLFVRTKDLPIEAHDRFGQHLRRECERLGLREQVFLAKKGDAFVWHGALCHTGTAIGNPKRTRLSLATHYSTRRAFPRRHLDSPDIVRPEYTYNGGYVYGDTLRPDRENVFTAGERV
jgi:hypothetical protein